jgi:hypothetical protein
MLKSQWLDLTVDWLAGGACPADLRGRYDKRIIEKYLEIVYSDIIYNTHRNAVQYSDYSQFDAYVKAYNDVPVLYDKPRNEYYCEMPAPCIELPKNRGVRLVAPMKAQRYRFIPTENNNADVRDALGTQSIVGYISFYREGGRVYFRNFNTDYEKLLFKLLVPFSEFDDDDPIGIPAISSSQVFASIVQLMLQRPPEKNTNDNQSKQI